MVPIKKSYGLYGYGEHRIADISKGFPECYPYADYDLWHLSPSRHSAPCNYTTLILTDLHDTDIKDEAQAGYLITPGIDTLDDFHRLTLFLNIQSRNRR